MIKIPKKDLSARLKLLEIGVEILLMVQQKLIHGQASLI